MRTKTVLLSALLGALGSVSVHAQNVYSLNAVGYINVTLVPGYSIITCPLIASPDNTINTLMNNANSNLSGSFVYFYNPGTGGYNSDSAANPGGRGYSGSPQGWAGGGTEVLAPGTACWFGNNFNTNITITFVGTVPTGPITNILSPGFNLVGSVVPVSGDIITNSISSLTNFNLGDWVYYWPAPSGPFTTYVSGSGRGFSGSGYLNEWEAPLGDPTITNVSDGFFYLNNGVNGVPTPVNWVENYSVSQ
jgi:hypothetical protein